MAATQNKIIEVWEVQDLGNAYFVTCKKIAEVTNFYNTP
jgi:hypothetical protein